jgi:hypothetical protein
MLSTKDEGFASMSAEQYEERFPCETIRFGFYWRY